MTKSANIAGHLPAMARARPEMLAVVDSRDATQYTYRDLDAASDGLAHGFARIGLSPTRRVALMIPPGVEFFAITFALFKLGAVPVFIDHGMGVGGVGRCLKEAEPDAFIGTPKAHLARRLFGWLRDAAPICVHVGWKTGAGWSYEKVLDLGKADSPPLLAKRCDNDVAAILFTSGSTGPAKGVVYTHGMFQEQVRVLREVFSIEPGEVDLCTFPLFALFAPALGMTAVVPDMDATRPAKADPRKLVAAIEKYKVTNLFGSPALINVLGQYCLDKRLRLPTLRRVISAGAPVSAPVIERMKTALSTDTEVFTPYGATECLPVAVIDSNEILSETRQKTNEGAGICVGRPVGQVEVRILPITDGPITAMPPAIEQGLIGELTVRAPVVSKSYWRRPDADALHKIIDGETVWHRTGDVGYFDDRGRLWFCGRKAHRVITATETLFTIPCEAIFNNHPLGLRTALVGAVRQGVVIPVICVEAGPRKLRLTRTLISELRDLANRCPQTRSIQHFLINRGTFPVDVRHNAKINREQLARWAARRVR